MPSPKAKTSWQLRLALAIGTALAVPAGTALLVWPEPLATQPDGEHREKATTRPEDGEPSRTVFSSVWTKLSFETGAEISPEKPSASPVRDIKLVGIFSRRGSPAAALEIGKGQPLVFLTEGESRDGITVTSFKGNAIQLVVDGMPRALEVRP